MISGARGSVSPGLASAWLRFARFRLIHHATIDAVLWVVTDEPLLAFQGVHAPAPGAGPVTPVHYPADEIQRQLAWTHALPPDRTTTGKAVAFGSAAASESTRSCPPSPSR